MEHSALRRFGMEHSNLRRFGMEQPSPHRFRVEKGFFLPGDGNTQAGSPCLALNLGARRSSWEGWEVGWEGAALDLD